MATSSPPPARERKTTEPEPAQIEPSSNGLEALSVPERKVPCWVARYRSGEPLGSSIINPDLERRRDPVLLALLKENPDWNPTNEQRDFVVGTRFLATKIVPVKGVRRWLDSAEGKAYENTTKEFEDHFSLALSNLLVHRYPSDPKVVALTPDDQPRRYSETPASDILASQWLVESLILCLPRHPPLIPSMLRVVSQARQEEMSLERANGIPNSQQGIHFGAKVIANFTMATVMAYYAARENGELQTEIGHLFSRLTGFSDSAAIRGLESGALELSLAKFHPE